MSAKMSAKLEKSWVTENGLSAFVVLYSYEDIRSHRCGYVRIPVGHMLHGVCYSEPKFKSVRTLELIINVHGGITHADRFRVNSQLHTILPEVGVDWCIGFDTAHVGDSHQGGQPLDYCISECESMARQLVELTESEKRAMI